MAALGGVEITLVARRLKAVDQELMSAVGTGVSVGLAELAEDETLDQLMARADAALLDTKTHRVK